MLPLFNNGQVLPNYTCCSLQFKWIHDLPAQPVNEEGVIYGDFFQRVIASTCARVTCGVVRLQKQQVVICFHFTQFCRELGGFPICHAWIVESSCDEQVWIFRWADIVIG